VGVVNVGQTFGSLVCSWDGREWVRETGAAANVRRSVLLDVGATPSGDVWAYGFRIPRNDTDDVDVIVHWDGRRWSRVPSPWRSVAEPGDLSLTEGLAAGRSGVWISSGGLGVAKWTGTGWDVAASANAPIRIAEWRGGLVGLQTSRVVRLTPTEHEWTTFAEQPEAPLSDIAASGRSLFTIGNDFSKPRGRGVLCAWSHRTWVCERVQRPEPYSVEMFRIDSFGRTAWVAGNQWGDAYTPTGVTAHAIIGD
jgi:hypothetical protein